MKPYRNFNIYLFLITLSVITAQDSYPVNSKVIAQIREEGLQRSQITNTLSYMTDVIGARLTNSKAMYQAQDWVVSEMKKIGLKNIINFKNNFKFVKNLHMIRTIIKNNKTKAVIADFTEDAQKEIICIGGIGGRGNINYKTSTRQTPRFAQKGTEGQKGIFELELKVLADVGLVGLPNAGKSTLLSVVSKARPKIADYPFTTLDPHLGIVKYEEFKSFTMADIPGLIKGASDGKGLGHKFLKHIERNRLLLFMIESSDPHPVQTFETLKTELMSFNKALLLKPIMLVRTKSDIESNIDDSLWSAIPEYLTDISSVTNTGLKTLIKTIVSKLSKL